jgi:hypothetical protein
MSDHRTEAAVTESGLEEFVAELTEAAYPVALRHGVRGSSIDMHLDLWRTLSRTVRRRAAQAGVPRP